MSTFSNLESQNSSLTCKWHLRVEKYWFKCEQFVSYQPKGYLGCHRLFMRGYRFRSSLKKWPAEKLLDVHNSSYDTQPHQLNVNYFSFIFAMELEKALSMRKSHLGVKRTRFPSITSNITNNKSELWNCSVNKFSNPQFQ